MLIFRLWLILEVKLIQPVRYGNKRCALYKKEKKRRRKQVCTCARPESGVEIVDNTSEIWLG